MPGRQISHQVAADEAVDAGDENPHVSVPCFDQFEYFDEVLQTEHQHVGVDAVFLAAPDDLLIQDDVRLDPLGASSSRPHLHEILRDILGWKMVRVEKTDQKLIISGNLVIGLIVSEFLEVASIRKECRMCRHPSPPELGRLEAGTAVISYRPVKIVRMDKANVPVDSLYPGIFFKGRGHDLEDIVPVIEIIRIDDADNVSGCHPDALVDSIIHAFVRLGNPSQTLTEQGLVFPNDIYRTIGTPAINNQILKVRIPLFQHAFNRVPDGFGAIKGDCNDREPHGIEILYLDCKYDFIFSVSDPQTRLISQTLASTRARYHHPWKKCHINPSFPSRNPNLKK